MRPEPPLPTATVEGISVWNGTEAVGPATVSWNGDTVLSVEQSDDLHPDYSLVPGLVDTHVHLDTEASESRRDTTAWPLITPREEQVFHTARHARLAAAAGITTLRDLSGSEVQLAVSRVFESGVLDGPRLLVNGPVGMTAGHGDLFVPPLYPYRARVADSPDECRKLVREWARMGAHGIKVFTSGGVLSTGDRVGWRNQTDAELEATIDEAHALGLLVACHAHTAEGVALALRLGVDSIEHGTVLDEAQIAELVEREVPIAPTLMINDAIVAGRAGVPTEASDKAKPLVAARDAKLAAAGRAGVRFVLGTDCNGHLVEWGEQWDELRGMADLFGWSAERALVAGTSDAAAALRLPRAGRVEPGSYPDFVIVRGRPWRDVDALRHEGVVAVVSRGRLVFGSLPGA